MGPLEYRSASRLARVNLLSDPLVGLDSLKSWIGTLGLKVRQLLQSPWILQRLGKLCLGRSYQQVGEQDEGTDRPCFGVGNTHWIKELLSV